MHEVIYALKIPTDIVMLFEETGTGFDPGLFSVPSKRFPSMIIRNIWLCFWVPLGVDLSYCTLFERSL